MRIIGLDLGTKCGWAVWDDGLESCGTWRLRNDPADMGVRYRDFHDRLLCLARPGDVIAYELVRRHIGTQAAHLYGGFQAIMFLVAAWKDVQLIPITVQAVKQKATRKGNAKKDEMVKAARAYVLDFLCYDRTFDDNAADAAFVALCAAELTQPNKA